MSLKARNGIDFGSVGQVANLPDPTTAQQAATKNYVDVTGLGRMAGLKDTTAATTMTSEVKIGQATFTAVTGRRYLFSVCGALTNSASGYASALTVRYTAGATVTTSGTQVLVAQNSAIQFTQYVAGFVEVTGIAAGQTAVGVFAVQQAATSGGTTSWGNGSVQPTSLRVDDIGT